MEIGSNYKRVGWIIPPFKINTKKTKIQEIPPRLLNVHKTIILPKNQFNIT